MVQLRQDATDGLDLTAERKQITDAPRPTRKSVEACLIASRKYRIRMANGIKGEPEASLREQMAQEVLRLWNITEGKR